MNLDDAIAQDKALKEKFLAAIATKVQLDATVIGKADRCILGNWLYGEAERKYPFLKAYKPCLEAHAAFHVQAGKVARQINCGEYADAEAMIGANTAYAKAWDALEVAAKLLKKDVKL